MCPAVRLKSGCCDRRWQIFRDYNSAKYALHPSGTMEVVVIRPNFHSET